MRPPTEQRARTAARTMTDEQLHDAATHAVLGGAQQRAERQAAIDEIARRHKIVFAR